MVARPEQSALQRELDLLRARVDQIDTHGTRGTASAVGVLASQFQDLVKDMAEMRTATQLWQERHETQHKDEVRTRADETRARVIGRRWVAGTCIAALVMLTTMLTLMLQLLGRIR